MNAATRWLAACLAAIPAVAPAQALRVPVAAGEAIVADLELPSRAGPLAVVVVVPGQGYARGGALFLELSEQARAEGFAVLRMDWRYTESKGDPSEDLVREVEDLKAALRFVRSDPRLDPERIYLAAKSLGTMVAARVLRDDPKVKGAALLTPVCRAPGEIETYYGAFREDPRPRAWIQGDRDQVCPLATLYAWLPRTQRPFPVIVLPGDHGFNVAKDDPARNRANVRGAARVAVRWLLDAEGR